MRLFIILLFYCFSCVNPLVKWAEGDVLPFKIVALEHKLDEISGLAFDQDYKLLSVNDEEGIIYTIDFQNGKIIDELKFKDEGDFEGIERLGEFYFVLESDGDLFKIDSKGNRKKYDLFEQKKFEFEGLCKLDDTNLLIACKHHEKKSKEDYIWIFQYNLEKEELEEAPFLKLKREQKLKHFRPSGICYSFSEQKLMIVSGVSQQILIVDMKNQKWNVKDLNKLELSQAEGIAIDQVGNVIISTEKNSFDSAKLNYFNQSEF